MKMRKGEMFDRWTILMMKAKLSENAKKELDLYHKEVMSIMYGTMGNRNKFSSLLSSVCCLVESNAKIWVTEAAIRAENPDDPAAKDTLGLEEIGRRALAIREYNKNRIEAKKAIDVLFGDIPDQKVQHASA